MKSPTRRVHRARVQPVPARQLPGRRSSTPRSRTATCARRSRTRSTASGSTRSRPASTSYPAHGILPEFYKSFYEQPTQDYPLDVDRANQILDDAGWVMGDDGVREKDGERLEFDLYVRSESPYNIQAAKLVAEQTEPIGVEFNVQVVSRRQAHGPDDPQGQRQGGAGLRHLHLGLGRRPLRPELPAQPLPVDRDRRPLGLVLRQPRVRQALRPSRPATFDVAERKAIIKRMVALTQRDLPYIVLTYDPNLQAYRTDTVAERRARLPRGRRRHHLRAGRLRAAVDHHPGRGERLERRRRPAGGPSRSVAAIVFGFGGWSCSGCARAGDASASRSSCEREARRERPLARGQGRGGAADARSSSSSSTSSSSGSWATRPPSSRGCRGSSPEEIEKLKADYGLDKPLAGPVRRLRGRHGDARPRDQPALAPARVGRRSRTRCRGRCCWSGSARCSRRCWAAGWGWSPRPGGARRTDDGLLGFSLFTYAAPEYWIGIILILVFAVCDPDLPGRAADVAWGRVQQLVGPGRRRPRPPDPARDRDDPDAARAVLPDHALVDGRRPHRGLRHREAGDGPPLAPGRAQPRGAERAAAAGHARGDPVRRGRRRRDHDRDDLLLARPRRAQLQRRSTTRTSRCCRGPSSSSRSG